MANRISFLDLIKMNLLNPTGRDDCIEYLVDRLYENRNFIVTSTHFNNSGVQHINMNPKTGVLIVYHGNNMVYKFIPYIKDLTLEGIDIIEEFEIISLRESFE